MEKNKKAKAIFLGDSKVGKSAIFSRITQNTFNEYNIATIGSICVPKIYINETKKLQITINFWDTAGQERYRAITKIQVYGSNIVIFCCEDEKSFKSIKEIWYKECEKLIDLSKCLKFILKTKCDIKCEDEHLLKEIKKYANKIDAIFFETSAKNNINIDALYESICFNVEKLNLDDDEAQIRINNINNKSKYNSSNCWC